jgi:hypothetical protein
MIEKLEALEKSGAFKNLTVDDVLSSECKSLFYSRNLNFLMVYTQHLTNWLCSVVLFSFERSIQEVFY